VLNDGLSLEVTPTQPSGRGWRKTGIYRPYNCTITMMMKTYNY